VWEDAGAALSQDAVRRAPIVLVIAAVTARTAAKYGARRSGTCSSKPHAGQNLLLTAVALGLGAVPVGAFDDAALGRALALSASERLIYLTAVGHPR
jgi:nitroreductase